MSLFNQRFKELKEDKNIMLKDLASDLGYSSSKLSYYLNGNNEPSYDELIKIANYFEVSVDYMLGTSVYKTKLEELLAMRAQLDTIALNDEVHAVLADLQYILHELYTYQNDYSQNHAFDRMAFLCKALNAYLEFCEYVSWHTNERYSEIIDYGYEVLSILEEFYNDFVSDINFEFKHIYDDPHTPQSIKDRMAIKESFIVLPSSKSLQKRVEKEVDAFVYNDLLKHEMVQWNQSAPSFSATTAALLVL